MIVLLGAFPVTFTCCLIWSYVPGPDVPLFVILQCAQWTIEDVWLHLPFLLWRVFLCVLSLYRNKAPQ